MINRLFLVANQELVSRAGIPIGENVFLSILIDPVSTENLSRSYKFAGEHFTKNPFCIAVLSEDYFDDEILAWLVSFLFMPSFLRIDSRPVLILTGAADEVIGHNKKKIKDSFSAQGIHDCCIHIVALKNEGDSLQNSVGFNSIDELKEYYKIILAKEDGYNNNIFFFPESIEIMELACSTLQDLENEFKDKFGKEYLLTRDIMQLKNENNRLKEINRSVFSEMQNQVQYNEILKQDHSTAKLQQYYNREYETLPLWYKRLGHILKVIMGKRRPGSLFKKSEKKYKD